jgi:hypothetical protein
MGVPEVVTKRRKREREVGCGSREGAEVVLWLPEVVRV